MKMVINQTMITLGVFKYVQVNIKDKSSQESKCVIRGYLRHEFHQEDFEDLESKHIHKLTIIII